MKKAEAAGSAAKLYTPVILGLAVELANYPPIANCDHSAQVRSRSCGSSLTMDITCDNDGVIEAIGLSVTACAIGQAAAVIFASHASGKTLSECANSTEQLTHWLGGQEEMPDWPDIELLAKARDYPGRHGAILLPWRAAVEALSNA